MDPVSMTFAAVGWLMSALVSKAVTALLEAWAKRIGLGNEFKTLMDHLQQLGALLKSARRLQTDNSFLDELVQDLQHWLDGGFIDDVCDVLNALRLKARRVVRGVTQQFAYRAENLLDELDYYRLEDEIQQRGIQEKVNYINKSPAASCSSGFQFTSRSIFSTLKGMSCCSAQDAQISLPERLSFRINLSQRMNELAEQLQKSMEKVCNALQTEALVITVQNTNISQTEETNIPQTSSFQTETREAVGRNQERDQLLDLLINEETTIIGNVLILAIVGCGGVGKTTLAGLVFNDPKVQSFFDVRSWICVSTHFDIVRLTREMLEGVCGNRYGELRNLNELQNKLKHKLESKRFLLVLDDMWEDEDKSQWDLMVALLNNCMVKRGIILLTTRNQSVAKMVDARDNINLLGLDYNTFLSFFSTCIFNDPNFGGNWRLGKIGQEIANKLKGNPLAAKTVSAMLKEKLDERYWMKIRDSKEWKSQSGQNDIMPALRLSYEQMPFHLQRCFSYCAIFSEDHPFTCKELVYLWMAQGFLDVRSEAKRMEDIGNAYFLDLFNRGFFQTIQSRYDNELHYTFHDLIHDLACVVSFKECFSINGAETKKIPHTIRHLSIFNSTKKTESEEEIVTALACLEGENLGTIFNWDKLPSRISRSILDLLKETKFLRVVRLDLCGPIQLHNCNFQNFVSLRYLRLIMSDFDNRSTLPREICRLYHLEVLEIEHGRHLNELPNNFNDLVSLRYFIDDINNNLHAKIQGIGKLTSLQQLNHFVVRQKKGFEIEQLGSLKEIGGSLYIWKLENVKSMTEASKARLAEKDKLDALYLKWNHGKQENQSVLEGLKPNTNLKWLIIRGYGGVASPMWLDPSLIFLDSLILENCKAWELLPPIGELESLKRLKLSKLAVRKIGPQCYGTRQSMKFPSLEKLKIEKMLDLEKWVWSDQLQQFLCFKKLKNLTIRDCPKLVDLPLSISATSEVLERFPSLESLEIQNCPQIFQLPPLPYSSLLSSISIEETKFIKSMHYEEKRQDLSLILDQNSSLKVDEVLAFHELSSLRSIEISNISSLESLDLHYFLALEDLDITKCQSLTSLTFGEHLICLKTLTIVSCKALNSMKGLKSWVNLKWLHFRECPSFIAAWDSASKEIQSIEQDFSLSLTKIKGDSLELLTMPICKQLTSLQIFGLEVSAFTEYHEVSLQLLTSIDLVDIRGYKKNLQSFPFDLFPSLDMLFIKFPHIRSISTNNRIEITEECLKQRNIKEVAIFSDPVKICFLLSSEEMISQQIVAVN